VYYILSGSGTMHVSNEKAFVHPGQAVYIPPGAVQWIENAGGEDLVFLAVVSPVWREEDETVLAGITES
jgi:cytosine deaminase